MPGAQSSQPRAEPGLGAGTAVCGGAAVGQRLWDPGWPGTASVGSTDI